MHSIAFLQNLSSWEIILIFLVVLLFFGAKRLPDLFRSFGKSLKEFKKATSDIEEDFRSAMDEEPEDEKKAAKADETSGTPATTAPKEVESENLAEEVESDDITDKNDAGTTNEEKENTKA
ncbi:MAG: twin-arginine translocase TatA/TatE family subunit [Opitutales bacterium]